MIRQDNLTLCSQLRFLDQGERILDFLDFSFEAFTCSYLLQHALDFCHSVEKIFAPSAWTRGTLAGAVSSDETQEEAKQQRFHDDGGMRNDGREVI
jgi:hypothetical protein